MYLKINGTNYHSIKRYRDKTLGTITYTGESIMDVGELHNIEVYRDDGFLLMIDDATQYPYQEIFDEVLKAKLQKPKMTKTDEIEIAKKYLSD